jgi:hypothetical protein
LKRKSFWNKTTILVCLFNNIIFVFKQVFMCAGGLCMCTQEFENNFWWIRKLGHVVDKLLTTKSQIRKETVCEQVRYMVNIKPYFFPFSFSTELKWPSKVWNPNSKISSQTQYSGNKLCWQLCGPNVLERQYTSNQHFQDNCSNNSYVIRYQNSINNHYVWLW